MTQVRVLRRINAPVERVFDTVAHVERFSEAIPEIINVEFLTDVHRGVGTRFRETRMMRKRRGTTELEVTEYVENERIRLVSDAGGTIWDTVFTVSADEGTTELTMVMDAKPYKMRSRLMTPLIIGVVRKAIARDMDAVKAHCEQT